VGVDRAITWALYSEPAKSAVIPQQVHSRPKSADMSQRPISSFPQVRPCFRDAQTPATPPRDMCQRKALRTWLRDEQANASE
jgi:hypothetical protein